MVTKAEKRKGESLHRLRRVEGGHCSDNHRSSETEVTALGEKRVAENHQLTKRVIGQRERRQVVLTAGGEKTKERGGRGNVKEH